MRKLVAALQVSLDGFIEGPDGELDWIRSWEDPFDILPMVDTFVFGSRMYPGYEAYWSAILADPKAVSPFTGSVATEGEVAYARLARSAEHVVLSSTLQEVAWPNTRVVRSVADIGALKYLPGKDIHAVGGASLVGSLINANLVDELRIVVQPILLGAGKPLFGAVVGRHPLTLSEAKPIGGGMVRMTYALPEYTSAENAGLHRSGAAL